MKHALAFLCLCLSFSALAQPIKRVSPFTARNSVYVEALGSGLVYSINYERLLGLKEELAYGIRAGTAYLGGRSGSLVLIGELFALIGEDNLHADFGIGLTSTTPLTGEDNNQRFKSTYALVPRIGYRYQKPTGGLMARIGFTPLIPLGQTDFSNRFNPWVGLSIGHSF
ncbi:hypothetical protein GK091_25255 [Spirosoma agri]|uniref:DUF3575 domain-containing protein n=1 Tax=Spirosoma agri TaxID=1987381 RepID=A0A6M0IPA8_9BACT|nr:hypothetical protein [Spirosoma agri]NEU70210.1 hypothetical protein [Spirosoma agri]